MAHQFKYIVPIFESRNPIKLIKTEGHIATILNPDGEEVSVTMEEDGQWDEWIEEPYVKQVSVSGDDDNYRYYMSATTDPHGHDFELTDEDLDYESLEDVKAREEANKKKAEERRAKWDEERRQQEEERQRKIADSGLSEDDYVKNEIVTRYKGAKFLIRHQKKIESGAIMLAKVHEPDYDDGKVYYDTDYIKVYVDSIPGGLDQEMTEMMVDKDIMEEVLADIKEVGVIHRKAKISDLQSIDRYDEYKKYLDEVPQYARVSRLIS